MPDRLPGRTAIVTGSSGALGRAITLALASEGSNICCVDLYAAPRNQTNPQTGKADSHHNRSTATSTLDFLHKQYGKDRAIFVQADVTSSTDWQNVLSKCIQKFGRIDILCNNAGISLESTHPTPLPIHLLPEPDWDATLTINAKSVFLGTKHTIPHFLSQPLLPNTRDRGWIINTSSVQGLVAYNHTPAYTASKSAVSGLTRQVALDYAGERIHCNAVCPGFLRTTMTQNLQQDAEALAEIEKQHPFGGIGEVEDVARAVVFLASEDAGWVTGVNLPVDGGYLTK